MFYKIKNNNNDWKNNLYLCEILKYVFLFIFIRNVLD